MSIRTIPIHTELSRNLSGKICLAPFVALHVGFNGTTNLCLCPQWQTTDVGNILTHSIDEILSSKKAIEQRTSIANGTYKYCKKNVCALIVNDALNNINDVPNDVKVLLDDPTKYKQPHEIIINVDRICNLSCPSCRTGIIKETEQEKQTRNDIVDKIHKNLFSTPSKNPLHIIPGAGGEIFASERTLALLNKLSLDDYPNLSISLHTNALLAQRNWPKVSSIESAITDITISIDAATEQTYELVRRGGIWADLLANLEFLKHKKEELGFSLKTRLIFQQKNYKEALDFYRLSKTYLSDRIEFSRITNWGTYSQEEFANEDVLDVAHPEFNDARAIVQQIAQLKDIWLEGNFSLTAS